ncbi:hypothetical protein [Dyadobacter sp. LHD-138]|uniref:hypothetical protein n=1 Tax=Dyadobacter sp. LHD-138 TaxID=3071413 RepID=UPI0027DFAE78|nr:hypothetical protein [Dyadobacter sp. LHD-138]MDQ6479477.1 hypothetical protein [Dyadobacter sp. LHD-138]
MKGNFVICLLIWSSISCINSYHNFQQKVVDDCKQALLLADVDLLQFGEMKFGKISDDTTFNINRIKKPFDFKTGKSFYGAIEVDQKTERYLLIVTSKRNGAKGAIYKQPTFFFPKVILLDKENNSISNDELLRSAHTYGENKLSISYLIDDDLAPKVKRVIVFTDPNLAGRLMSDYFAHNGSFGTEPPIVRSDLDGEAMLNVEGQISIKIKGKK